MTREDDQQDEAFTAAARLQESMGSLQGEIRTLRVYGKRNRRYIWALTISIALDLVLSVVIAFVAVQSSNANTLANQNAQVQKSTCEAGNQARAVTVQLWTYVLEVSAQNPENQTPAKKQQIEKFRAYMTSAYAQRDCSAGK